MITRKGSRVRTYVTATDPKTKKSVSVTLPGHRDEVIQRIEQTFLVPGAAAVPTQPHSPNPVIKA